MNNFPTIGEYNQAIKKNGGRIFRTLFPIDIVASKTLPIKVFLFGSGAYAAVFKGKKDNSFFALRCFLSAEKDVLSRYAAICNYLKNIDSQWKTSCQFLNNEVEVNNSLFPVLKMDWVEGDLINIFVSNNLANNKCLTDLQIQLLHVSRDLESHKIGHGDLQCGNIMISGSSEKFFLYLIDYDGMYVPSLSNQSSIEKGRSEFQHPKRTLKDFNPEMDRFSFWVILTALEALKFDKTLWKEVMQGGFNTLDNFLFTVEDFLNPGQSKLWKRLYELEEPSLNYYLNKLESICRGEISQVTPPRPWNPTSSEIENNNKTWDFKSPPSESPSPNKIFIKSLDSDTSVMTLSLVKIGTTPLELDRDLYKGRTLLISNGLETQRLYLEENKDKFLIEWKITEQEIPLYNKNERTRHTNESSDNNNWTEATPGSKNSQVNAKIRGGKKNSWRNAAIIIGVLLSLGFTGYHLDIFSSPVELSTLKEDTVEHDHTSIKNLIRAEDQRDFLKIYSFYSPNLKRYWDENYPSKDELKAKYEYSWSLTSLSSNHVLKIEEVGEREYNVHTNFKYYNRKIHETLTLKSIVYFALDDNGKVMETYGIDVQEGLSSVEKKKVTPAFNSAHFKRQIEGILKAEEERNFQKVYSYFSPRISRYWNINNPNKTQLHKNYSNLWQVTSNSKNEIIKIEEAAGNIFHLHTVYSYYDVKKFENIAYNSVVRFEFGEDGKITKIYGESSERIYPEENVSSQVTSSNETEKYTGDFVYITRIGDFDFDVLLRSKPNVNSEALYTCPLNAKVYVLDTQHNKYYKVFINGYYGYISKALL